MASAPTTIWSSGNPSFSDGTNTYVVIGAVNDTSGGQRTGHAYVANNATSGKTTITFTPPSTVDFLSIWVREIGGVKNQAPDGTCTTYVSTATANPSGSLSNLSQPAFMSAFCCNADTGITPSVTGSLAAGASGWTFGASTNLACTGQESISTTGSQSATFHYASGSDTATVLAAIWDTSTSSGAALAGTPVAATTATGRLNSDFIAAAADATAAAGALTTAIRAAAAALATTTGSGTLTTWSTVTLAAPLYFGVGSVLNAEGSWSNGTPGVGATIYYDGTNMTINTDGSIVATGNNFAAVCQWDNGGTWSDLTVIVTPGLSAYATLDSAINGSLTTAIKLAAAAVALTSASASLSTGIQLAAAATAVTTAVGALSTQILAAAAVSTTTVGTGSLTTQIELAANATMLTTLVGSLLTAIQLAAAATAVTTGSGTLSTGSGGLSATASDATALAASLTTQIRLLGAAIAAATLVADLSTQIRLAGGALGASGGAASLTTQIELAAAVTEISQANAALHTLIQAAANAQTLSAAVGVLNQAAFTLGADARVETAAAGPVTTGIDVQGIANDDSDAGSALTAAGSDVLYFDRHFRVEPRERNGIVDQVPLFFAEQLAGDALRYAIDWTDWLSSYWRPGIQVAIGDRVRARRRREVQFKCVAGGITSSTEPRWPYGVGAQVLDGNGVIWQAEPIDDESLAAHLEPPSVSWAVLSPLMLLKPQVFDERITLVTIDTTNATPGFDYDAGCLVQTSDGRQKIVKIRLKVR